MACQLWRRPTTRSLILAGTATILIVQFVLTAIIAVDSGLFSHIGMDFLTTYTAAKIIGAGGSHEIYSSARQIAVQTPIVAHYHVRWLDRIVQPYIAPPILALLAMPLRYLSAALAYLVWVMLSGILFLIGGRLLDRELDLRLGRLMPLLVLSFFPVYYTLLLGQSEAILLFGLIAFILLSLRGLDLPAGLALGLLVLKPPLLLAPVIYLIVKRRWSALLGLGTAGAAAAAISAAMLGPHGILNYVRLSQILSQPAGTLATNVPGMINIRGVIVRVLPNAAPSVQQLAILALSITLIAVTVTVWRRSGPERDNPAAPAELALLAVTTVLVSYHTLIHTGALLLPAFALLWRTIDDAGLGTRYRVVLLGLAAIVWIGPTMAFIPERTSYFPAILMTPLVFGLWLLSAECLVRVTTLEPALAKVGVRVRVRPRRMEPGSRW